ncbi:hypothetical protein [Arcobacter aquimarinus]|uniref:hypothetical protein n=1 Tax=Arcobacter aquimarinus TaxID=1315211 RepID=UPI003BAEC8C6
MAEAVDIKKQIIDDMLETLKEQVSRYKSLINSNDVTLDQLKDFDNQISEIYDTLQKVSNTQLTLLVSEIEDYKTQFQTKLSEFENILNNIDVSNITLNLTPEQIESLKGDKGQDGQSFTFDMFTPEQLESLKGEKGDKGEDGQSFTFDMFSPEQLQSLKGDKGDRGQDGLITVDSMTEQQKQEIANLVNVSSSSTSSSNITLYNVVPSLADYYSFVHLKTNLKFNSSLLLNLKYFRKSTSSGLNIDIMITFLEQVLFSKISYINSFNYDVYLSEDGYFCIAFLHDHNSYNDYIALTNYDGSRIEIIEALYSNTNATKFGTYSNAGYVE